MRSRINYACYYLILISLFLSACFSCELLGVIICTLLSFIIAFNTHRHSIDGSTLLMFGFLLIILQNLLIGLGAHIGGNTSSNLMYLTQFPTIYCFCIGGYQLLVTRKREKTDIIFLMLFLVLFCALFISSAKFSSKLVYFRNCTVFYFAYVMGREYGNRKYLDRVCNFVINVSIILVIVGFIMMAFPVEVWNAIGLKEVYIAKGTSESTFLASGLPIRFYTSIGRFRFYRMASIIYEPVNLSYILSISLIILMFIEKIRYRAIKTAIVLIGTILTFGKGGILIVCICLIYYIIMRFCRIISINRKKRNIFFVLLIIAVVGIVAVFYYTYIGGSAQPHFRSIINTIQSVIQRPLGYGLGYGGNYGSAAGLNNSSGQESGLMAIMYQMGIPFTACFVFMFISLFMNSKPVGAFQNIVALFPLTIVIASLFQENTLGPQCCYIYMIMAGILNYGYTIGKERTIMR